MEIINYNYNNELLDKIYFLCRKGKFIAVLFNNVRQLKNFAKLLKTKLSYKRGIFVRKGIVVLFIDENIIYENMFDYKFVIK